MKIKIPGRKIQSALTEQLTRMKEKRAKYQAYMEQHTEAHGRPPKEGGLCVQEVQARVIYNSMDVYALKLNAAIDAISVDTEYTMSLNHYLCNFVVGPYDNVVVPDDPSVEADLHSLNLN